MKGKLDSIYQKNRKVIFVSILGVITCGLQAFQLSSESANLAVAHLKLHQLKKEIESAKQKSSIQAEFGDSAQASKSNLMRNLSSAIETIAKAHNTNLNQLSIDPATESLMKGKATVPGSGWSYAKVSFTLKGAAPASYQIIQEISKMDYPIGINTVAISRETGPDGKPSGLVTTRVELALLVNGGTQKS